MVALGSTESLLGGSQPLKGEHWSSVVIPFRSLTN